MNKIGIATYIKSNNYGSVLQSFALKNVIANLGYDVVVIDFKDMKMIHNKKMKLINILSSFAYLVTKPSLLKQELSRKKKINISSYNLDQIKIEKFKYFQDNFISYNNENYFTNSNFDVFVAGSDQVWKLTVPGLHSFFFLRFTNKKKRIAYAPSFGGDYLPNYNKNILRKYLNDFNSISIREKSGAKIIKDLIGRDVDVVLDPVLLAGKNFWLDVLNKNRIDVKIKKEYILCYFLDSNELGINVASKLADMMNLKIIWIKNDNEDNNLGENFIPSPLEFVSLINNASYVVTDSFHGVAFSLLLNTNFYVTPREYKLSKDQETRILSVLEIMKQSDRFIDTDKFVDFNDIDFAQTNSVMMDQQKKSMDYLRNAINSSINK